MRTILRTVAMALMAGLVCPTVDAEDFGASPEGHALQQTNPYSRDYKYVDDSKAFGTFYAEYNNMAKPAASGSQDDDLTYHGVSVGFHYFVPVVWAFGFDAGVKAQYFFRNKDLGLGIKDKSNMFAATVPVNAVLDLRITDDLAIDPFVGVYGRYNFTAKDIKELNGQRTTHNLFNSEQTTTTWNRFQMGWQLGVNLRISNVVTIGGAYWHDMGKIVGDTRLHGFNVMLGANF